VDINNAKNEAKTNKIWLKQVYGLNETSWAKTKKSVANREKSIRWKDRVVNLKEGGVRALVA
jgi:hypothetical protein